MIVYGSKKLVLGTTHEYCEKCGQERDHRVCLEYGFHGLLFVLNMVTYKKYTVVCTVCHEQCAGDPQWIDQEFSTDNHIPTLDRHGCLFLMMGVGLLFVIAALLSGALR